MTSLTKGQAEDEFTKAIVRFEKEYLGRGPLDARTFFIKDMILVRLQGVLTPAEQKLVETSDGRSLIKETRRQLFETSRPLLAEIVASVTGSQLVSLHSDMSTRTGERIIVFTLSDDLDKRFR
ncbi:MAG: DUF2294 domain-containing protein [Chloroflexota bacterium]|nr:DUF2294 domain-containing protein [Anaerolineales bacterium]MCB8966586.1 DUF2294 domain-containing protein [Ardenticatenaceae bacterium]